MKNFKFKILNLYVLKKLLFSFLFAEVVYSIVFFIQNLFLLSSLIVEKNAPAYESLLLILYMLPKTITNTIPFSVIFAALFVTFQLASKSELIAINSAGIELKKQQTPYLIFSLILTLSYGFLLFYILPLSKVNRDKIINKINIKSIIYSLTPGEFNKISDNFYIYAKNVQKNLLNEVMAFNYKNFNTFEIIYSKQAMLVLNTENNNIKLSLKFFRGKAYSFALASNSRKLSRSSFGKKVLSITINQDYFVKKDTKKGEIDKLTLNSFFNFLKTKDKIAISIFIKRIAMILFVFLSPFLGFFIGFSLKRGTVVSGAIVYSFVISFFYIIFLNIFINLMQHNLIAGFFLVLLLLFSLFYFLYLNKEKIAKPLKIKEKRNLKLFIKNQTTRLQSIFEIKFLKRIEEKELVSLKFPLLMRYIIFNFIKIFLIFFIILQSIYLLTITLKIIVNLFKYKGNILLTIKFIIYSTLSVYPLILPFSFLMAVLFYFMSLEDKNELIAIKSSGISLYTIIMPIGYLALFLSVILLFFTTLFSPLSTKKASYLYYKINKKKKMLYIQKLKSRNRSIIKSLNNKNSFYWYDYYDFKNNIFFNFLSMEFDFSSGELIKLYRAEKLLFQSENLKTHINDLIVQKNNNEHYIVKDNPEKPLIWDSILFFKEIEPKPEELTQFELREFISKKKKMGVKPYKYITDYYYRFASAFSPLVLLLFGLPLALMGEGRKKKPASGIALGLSLVVIYYVFTSLSLSFGAQHYLPSFFAAWLVNLLFSFSGLYLFTRIKT